MGIDSLRIARLSVDSRLPDSLKEPKAAQGFLGDPVGSFVGSLPCVLLCALTIEWTGKRQKEENCCYVH